MADAVDSISGLSARYRADSITGLTDGAGVASWGDTSGNANPATQATTANQPKFYANVLNGKPVVRFDGSTFMTSNAPSGSAQQTIIAIATNASSAGTSSSAGTIRGSLASGGLQLRSDNSTIRLIKQSVSNLATATSGVGIGVFGAVVAQYDAATGAYAFKVNGASAGSGSITPASLVAGGSSIGRHGVNNAEFLVGDIAELIVYSKVLSAAEVAAVDTYIQDTYAIQVADYVYPTTSSSRFVRSGDLVDIVMANVKAPRISVKTADYTLTLKDVGTVIEMNTPNSNRVTVPSNATVALPIGALVTITQVGAGRTNVIGDSGVAFDAPFGLALNGRYATIQLRQRATNEWVVTGSATEFIDVNTVGGLVYRMRAAKQPYNDGDLMPNVYPEVGSTVLSQATVASQPRWYASGKNGKPYISFDGVDDYVFNATSVGYSQPFTIAVAAQTYNANGERELVKIGGLELIINTGTSLGPRWSMYSGSSTDSTFQAGGVTSFVASFGVGGTGNGRAYTNGTLTSSNTTGNNVTNGDFYVGTHTNVSRFLAGDIYEILMYNSALTTNDLLYISKYFRSYYQ